MDDSACMKNTREDTQEETRADTPQIETIYCLLDDLHLLQWRFDMIKRLVESLSVKTINFCVSESLSLRRSGHSPWLTMLFKLDARLSHCSLDALRHRKLDSLSGELNTINLEKLDQTEFLKSISQQPHNAAIVINLGEQPPDEKWLNKIKTPVFSIFIGHNPGVASWLTGLPEFIAGENKIYTGVRIDQAGKGGKILFQSTTSIEPPSLCRTLQTCLNKTSVFMERSLRQFLNGASDTEKITGLNLNEQPEQIMQKLSFKQNLALTNRFVKRIARRIHERFTLTEQWIILLARNDQKNQPNKALSRFKKIIPPLEEFWADPFIIEHQNRHYLFIEVFPFATEKGHISCMEVREDGSVTEPVKVLERPYHLSYPNVFEYQGAYYMVPETGDNQTIELYQATNFPYEWTFKHTLMENIRAYDASLIFHDGLWWLFAAVSVTEDCPTTEELYLFYADSPLSQEWTAHANNPVVSDAASARPAGKLIQQGDKLIRPSQNCAGSYGAGINFCEIQCLSRNGYRETILETLNADWDENLLGVHTFNSDSLYTVSDAILARRKQGLVK